MPVFINEVVIRGDLRPTQSRGDGSAEPAGQDSASREALIAEVTREVIDYLEREQDRIGER